MAKQTEITCRCWELVTNQKDQNGKEFLTEETIEKVLNRDTVVRWAWVLHDKDVYINEPILKEKPELKGEKKSPHYHIVMEFSYSMALGRLAEWFGVPQNFFEKGQGSGAFYDKCVYLTHEDAKQQDLGKALYPDEEIHASFNFREEIDEYLLKKMERKAKYGKARLNSKEEIRMKVLIDGVTLKEVQEKHPLMWADDRTKLKQLRGDYLCKQKPSPVRMNIYIDGKGRVGKDLTSVGIARSWFPNLPDDECFFHVGAKGVAFEGYDGQPVIIWSDRRAGGFISEFGRENVFDGIFNTFPKTASKQNIKYSSVPLVNAVNIVNGIEGYEEFLDGLAGEYTDRRSGNAYKAEDKNQSYGRFPMIIPVRFADFDILLNKGYMEGNTELFQEYFLYKNVAGNMRKIAELCNDREQLALELEGKLLGSVVDVGRELVQKKLEHGKHLSDDEIRNQLSYFGTERSEKELKAEYETIFTPLWRSVFPNKNPDIMIDFEDWVKAGKHNAYDYKRKTFYRID